jgi:hypothetical protein
MMELNQFKYINDVLKRYGMENCKPNSTSHETRLKLIKNQSPCSNKGERWLKFLINQ